MNLEDRRSIFADLVMDGTIRLSVCPPTSPQRECRHFSGHNEPTCADCFWAYITGGEEAVKKLHSDTLNTAEESADTSLD